MHFTKNKISNSYNIIAMGDEKWEGEYLKEFSRWVEKYEKTWKSAKKELRIIIIGIEQDKKELKIDTLILVEKKKIVWSLCCKSMQIYLLCHIQTCSI